MNQQDFNKLLEIRKLLKEAYDHVFDHLHEELESTAETLFGGYDLKEWEKFGIDRYWSLDYDSRKAVDHYFSNSIIRKSWYEDVMMKKLYEDNNANIK